MGDLGGVEILAAAEDHQALVLLMNESEQSSLTKSTQPSLDEVEKILGYEFKNKALLEDAFTHSSVVPGNEVRSFERLEFVGDSVLNVLISTEQYWLYPDLNPGQLTRLRAANVDTEKLARVALKHGLYSYLRHKKPKLDEQVQEFGREIVDFPLHSNGLIEPPKNLADIVESAIGAVYMDSNCSLDTVWKVFKRLLEPIITPETIKRHPAAELHELCQKNNLKLRFVDLWNKSKEVYAFIDDQLVGRGVYSIKKEVAQNRAAKDALDNIWKVLGEKKNVDNTENQVVSTDHAFGHGLGRWFILNCLVVGSLVYLNNNMK